MNAGGAARGAKKREGTFRALRHRDFRLLWGGLLVSSIGTWMQIVAQALLVLQISHGSSIALGFVSLAQALSFFVFALVGGAIADRVDKRRLLLVTQSLQMTLAFTLGVLTITGVVRVWMVVVLAFVTGTVLSFDQPTRSALVPELVPKADLMNAVSLQSIVFTGASTVGPALAGVVATAGLATCFFLNAASYLGVLVAIVAMHTRTTAVAASQRGALSDAWKDGIRAVRRDEMLPWVFAIYGAVLFFGPSPPLLLSIFGTVVLHLDPVRLGALFSALGLGTVAGGLALASLGDPRHKGRILIASACLWAAALAAFSVSRAFAPALAALFVVGIFQVGISATCITLLQTRVAPQMRGRVMSLGTLLVMGVRPMGDFPAGALIHVAGAPFTAALAAAIVGGCTAIAAISRRALRDG